MTMSISQGWTERVRFQLKKDGTVLDVSGMTIAIVATNALGAVKTFGGTIGADDPSNGIVYLDPLPTDFLAVESPLRMRWEVTDISGKSAFFPRTPSDSNPPIIVTVQEP